MSPQERLELLRSFAPRLHFDALERWRPSLADRYIEHSTFVDGEERAVAGTPPAGAAMVERNDELESRLNPLADGPGLDTQLRSNEMLAAYGSEQDLDTAGTCYGRVVPAADATYLQYWLFYPDNPCVLPPGRHDGDWELVQLTVQQVDGAFKATEVTLAEHGKPVTHKVDPSGGGIDVFVAIDSHACYFDAGAHPMVPLSDVCDPEPGATGAIPAVTLLPIEEGKRDWAHWKGRWGMDHGTGTWLALHLRLKRTPSWMKRLNNLGAGESPPSPANQGASWTQPSFFALRGTQRKWTAVALQRLVHFAGRLTWPREQPEVTVRRVGPGSYTVEAKATGRLVRRVSLVAVTFEELAAEGGRRALGMHDVRPGRPAGPFEIGHEGPLVWRAAGYNFLRQRGEATERQEPLGAGASPPAST